MDLSHICRIIGHFMFQKIEDLRKHYAIGNLKQYDK
jgi:hypothetical protein